MSFMTTFKTGAAVAAVAFTMSAGASAAATLGSIPGGSAINDGLVPIYGSGADVQGWYGATIFAITGAEGATVTATYHGKEAGFLNSFTLGGTTIDSAPSDTWSLAGYGSASLGVMTGLLDFLFGINSGNGGTGTVVNGANPDGSAIDGANFFATFKPSTGETALSGTILDLWLDDNGAGPDDNHDDMMIRLTIEGGTFTVVPVPASIPLLLTALGGLGLVARRRARQA